MVYYSGSTENIPSEISRIQEQYTLECCIAFITLRGMHEWICVLFGLCNAPGVSWSVLRKGIPDVRVNFTFPYLDVLVI